MPITFGGLATGIDTDSIVSELMTLERAPLNRLEADKTWLTNRLDAFTQFDARLNSFKSLISDFDSSDDFKQKSISLSDEDYFTATGDENALAGTVYNIEVVELAQVQKSVTTGFADKGLDQFGDGSISITVGSDVHTIDIAAGSGSLEGVMNAINDAEIGVSAAIINDGTASPYRLVLTGETVAESFTIDVSGLSNGALLDPPGDPIANTQNATQAHIRVDNIDIYSESNTLTEAIPGVTLNLLKAEAGTETSMDIRIDEDAIKGKIQDFVAGYNAAISFVTGQSVIDGSSGGILSGDSGLNAVKRHMQDLLTKEVATSGSLNYLSQLGLETQEDGTLQIDDTVLTEAIQTNLEDVEKLLVGEEGVEGIGAQFIDYIDALTDSTDGLLAGRKESIDSNLKRIESRMEQVEIRLEKKEETLRKQFSAMEELVSSLNSQSSFLTQQMNMLSNMMSGDNS